MLTFDFREWEIKASAIDGASRQVPFVIAYALTKSMQDAREAERTEMVSVFDRPRAYTLNSMRVIPATKQTLTAELSFKTGSRPASKWLAPEVTGGSRQVKAFERMLAAKGALKPGEFVVPGKGVRLDAQGNIPRATLMAIAQSLGIVASRPTRKGVPAKRQQKPVFVVRSGLLHPGVYQRSGGRGIVPLLLFVTSPTYEKRLHYYETARRVVPESFRRHFHEGWQRFVVDDVRRSVRRAG
ncbi:hypothetical protein [Rhodoplanes roseus]|uniref:Uncharacterized protein n=1 Tax=Rhodoplanes roseus TaxID=29409 RepID=A0A327KWV4_9BRAD|nr:hypothetical protein [Rhodoplanes roseus]RAI42637.1 hypothetical protein CH341_18430 [Rhodoplanes roseus]